MEIPMAYYQDANSLVQLSDLVFDKTYVPGESVVYAGIYKCAGCDREVAVDSALPSEDHHRHLPHQSAMQWKMIVRARAEPHN